MITLKLWRVLLEKTRVSALCSLLLRELLMLSIILLSEFSVWRMRRLRTTSSTDWISNVSCKMRMLSLFGILRMILRRNTTLLIFRMIRFSNSLTTRLRTTLTILRSTWRTTKLVWRRLTLLRFQRKIRSSTHAWRRTPSLMTDSSVSDSSLSLSLKNSFTEVSNSSKVDGSIKDPRRLTMSNLKNENSSIDWLARRFSNHLGDWKANLKNRICVYKILIPL